MKTLKQQQAQSRLGQILVQKKLISHEQLSQAMHHQASTGKRLGDILTEWDVVTKQHVQLALGTQRKLRIAASLVAAMLAPLHAYADTPASTTLIAQNEAAQAPHSKMLAMTEADLDAVSAQGLNDDLLEIVTNQSHDKDSGTVVLGKLVKAMNPILGFLDADTSIKGVVYDHQRSMAIMNPNGSITLGLPVSIREISFNHIRPMGSSANGPSFGSISLKDIQFNNTKITLSLHP